jgi:hypothetical protein
MRMFVALPLLLAAVSPAHADKSERTATILSATGAGVSSGLVLASFLVKPEDGEVYMPTLYVGLGTSIVTPSLGQLYSEQWVTIGMGIRAAAAGLALYGLTRDQDQPCIVDPQDNCPTLTGTGFTLIAIAAIAYIGGVAYDVRDSDDAARRYNKRRKTSTAFAPTAMPGGGGFAVVGSF